MSKIMIEANKCDRCDYVWPTRGNNEDDPIVCANPKCKSPYWNKPKLK